MSQASVQTCPILTHAAVSLQEAIQGEVPEIRAYKLGKRRWSYNQVELVLCELGEGARVLTVKQAVNMGTDNFKEEVRESSVSFQVQLANEYRVQVHAFLCYDAPMPVEVACEPKEEGGEAEVEEQYSWSLVERCACQKGCTGPVVRAIQRFGKLGKRAWGTSSSPDLSDRTNNNMKDPRYFYLSFDEAGTHVGVKTFRLVVAVYDQGGRRRLSTCVSPPIRVLANNDVPTGAAHILLHAQIPSSWEGWAGVPAQPADTPLFMSHVIPTAPRLSPGKRTSGSPMMSTPASRHRPSSSAESADHSHHSSSGGQRRRQAGQEDAAAAYMATIPRGFSAAAMAAMAAGHGLAPAAHSPQQDRRAKRRLVQGEDPDYVPRRNNPPMAGTPTRMLPPRHHGTGNEGSPYATGSGSPNPGIANIAGANLMNTFNLHAGQAAGQQPAGQQQGSDMAQMLRGSQGAPFALLPPDLDQFALSLDMDINLLNSQSLTLGSTPNNRGTGSSPNMSPYQQSAAHQQQLAGGAGLFLGGGGGPAAGAGAGAGGAFSAGGLPSLAHLSPSSLPLFSDATPRPGFSGLGQGSPGSDPSIADDPISAFLEILMKTQAPSPGSPIIELPNLSPGGSPTKSPVPRAPGAPAAGGAGAAGASGPGAGGSALSNTTGFLPLVLTSSPLSKQQQQAGGQQQQQQQQMGGGQQQLQQQQQQQQHQVAVQQVHPQLLPQQLHPSVGHKLQQLAGGVVNLAARAPGAPGAMPPPPHPSLQQQPAAAAAALAAAAAQQQQQRKGAGGHHNHHQQGQQEPLVPAAFGSTIQLFQDAGKDAAGGSGCPTPGAQQAAAAAAAQQAVAAAQKQLDADLFFRRNPGLAGLNIDPARLSPLPGKLDGQLLEQPPMPPPLSPGRLLPSADLSPLNMAHSPNSISTPTPSALDDIFNSFQPTLETAAEALMQGDSAFAAPSIKPEPGLSSGTSPGTLLPPHAPNSLAVQ